MTDPNSQHLYVMQNEYGCIKIGRSVDPWRRMLNLRQTEHCRIELVAAFEGGGEKEEAIHQELGQHRLEGEWFDGTHAVLQAIRGIFQIESFEWKFSHDPAGAAKWLDHLRVVRNANFVRQAITRQIGILRATDQVSSVHDRGIFYCRYLAAHGQRPNILVDRLDGKIVSVWTDADEKWREMIPAYTSSVELALLAWPDKLRPKSWEGSAIACCIAALLAMRQNLPRFARR